MFDLHDRSVVSNLRILDHRFERVHRAGGYIFRGDALHQLGGVPLLELFDEAGLEVRHIHEAIAERRVARVFGHIRRVEGAAQPLKLRVGGRKHHTVAVGGFAEFVEVVEGEPGHRPLAHEGVGHHAVAPEEREPGVDHRELDMLAARTPLACE